METEQEEGPQQDKTWEQGKATGKGQEHDHSIKNKVQAELMTLSSHF